jgi:hypothetical protein
MSIFSRGLKSGNSQEFPREFLAGETHPGVWFRGLLKGIISIHGFCVPVFTLVISYEGFLSWGLTRGPMPPEAISVRNRVSGYPPITGECRGMTRGWASQPRGHSRSADRLYLKTRLGYTLFDITYIIMSTGELRGYHRGPARQRPVKALAPISRHRGAPSGPSGGT